MGSFSSPLARHRWRFKSVSGNTATDGNWENIEGFVLRRSLRTIRTGLADRFWLDVADCDGYVSRVLPDNVKPIPEAF
jgi:hypothetical protein